MAEREPMHHEDPKVSKQDLRKNVDENDYVYVMDLSDDSLGRPANEVLRERLANMSPEEVEEYEERMRRIMLKYQGPGGP